jgi:hypothetical protein
MKENKNERNEERRMRGRKITLKMDRKTSDFRVVYAYIVCRIWHGSSDTLVTHILSFLFSRIRDHMAVGQADVNYSLPRASHLFII